MRTQLELAVVVAFAMLGACGGAAETESDAAPPDAPAPVTCEEATGTITLHATGGNPTRPSEAARVIVFFYQLSGNVAPQPPPFVAYDRPFDALVAGEERCVEIPTASIEAPTADEYLFCDRACFDASDPACDCPIDGPRATTGFVFVSTDGDGSGSIESSEVFPFGVGYLDVSSAPAAHTPGTVPVVDQVFVEGLEAGVHPYRIVETGAIIDQLGLHEPGTVYELTLCHLDDETCEAPYPDIH